MDGFSVTSLTSLCDTISHVSISLGAELDELLRSVDDSDGARQPLSSLRASLQGLGDELARLHASVTQATALSPSLRNQLKESLSECQATLGHFNKQVMRLDAGVLERANLACLAAHKDYFESTCQLYRFYTTTLHINDMAQQVAALESTDGQTAASQVEDASSAIAKSPEVIQDEGGAAPSYDAAGPSSSSAAGGGELPPPYEDANNANNANGPDDGDKAKEEEEGGFDLSSLKHSWQALTSGLGWFKPDPLVTALCEASLRGDVKVMSGLLQQGANIDGRNDKSMTPLACAVRADQAAATRFLLSAGANDKTGHKIPPLFEAAMVGSLDAAQILIERGAKASQKTMSGHHYFYDVVNNDESSLDGVRFLLQNGAGVTMGNLSGRHPIVCAVRKGRVDLVKLLLEYGAAASSQDYTGSSILSLAIDQDPDSEMVDLLLQRGAPADSRTISGQHLVAVAVSKRSLALTRKLLERGAKGDAKDLTGSPLIINVIKDSHLSEAERTEYVRLLLLHGASVTAKDIAGQAPVLHHAINHAGGDVVHLLLDYGADATRPMSGGESLLCHAIAAGRRDHIEALLRHRVDPNAPSQRGQSPLMMALLKHDLQLLQLLRQHGAEINKEEFEVATLLGRADVRRAIGLSP